jgi:hypothetical protein
MPFKPGDRGNPAGRPKGSENKATRDIRLLAQNLFDADYWKATKKALKARTLNPMIEKVLLGYAYGEPKKTLTLEGEIGIREKRRVLTQIPDAVVAQIAAQDAFETTEAGDGLVN